MGRNAAKHAGTHGISIGGVKLQAGEYLASNAAEPVKKRPAKRTGYAYFDGETLTLQNYVYSGRGELIGSFNVGLDISGATTEVIFRGENVIEVAGVEKSAALLINDGKTTIRGKGTLMLRAAGGTQANFAMLGSGTVQITSGTVRLSTQVGTYTIGEEGQRIFAADSYAVKLGRLIARRARVRGDDREEDRKGRKGELNELNRNNETEVVIDFPHALLWWWHRGCFTQLLLILITTIAVGVTIHTLATREPEIIEPDFPLLDIEPNAEQVEPVIDPEEQTPSTGGGGSVVLNFSYDVHVDLSEAEARLYFGLPGRSNKDAVLQLIVDDLLLAQSGRLPPGYHISLLDVEAYAIQRLKPGEYEGRMRILYYDDDTGERAILDTEIEVDVTVVE